MIHDDEFNGPDVNQKPPARRRTRVSPRVVLYLHLCLLIPSILIGRCEHWGYGHILGTGLWGLFFGPIASLICLSMYGFPIATFLLLISESPRGRGSWMAFPLSVMISYVQFLAFLPLVQ
jgi:hypothetical protein